MYYVKPASSEIAFFVALEYWNSWRLHSKRRWDYWRKLNCKQWSDSWSLHNPWTIWDHIVTFIL